MKASETLYKAADEMAARGKAEHKFVSGQTGAVCAAGAILAVLGLIDEIREAHLTQVHIIALASDPGFIALRDSLGCVTHDIQSPGDQCQRVFDWSDTHSQEEVILGIKEVAYELERKGL